MSDLTTPDLRAALLEALEIAGRWCGSFDDDARITALRKLAAPVERMPRPEPNAADVERVARHLFIKSDGDRTDGCWTHAGRVMWCDVARAAIAAGLDPAKVPSE